MSVLIETKRLILRELDFSDAQDLFEMDANPEVHLYIDNSPVKSIDEITTVIEILKNQYKENGIARWAVVDKLTKECLGWSGLKYFKTSLNNHINFYELGYRFNPKSAIEILFQPKTAAFLNSGLLKGTFSSTFLQSQNPVILRFSTSLQIPIAEFGFKKKHWGKGYATESYFAILGAVE